MFMDNHDSVLRGAAIIMKRREKAKGGGFRIPEMNFTFSGKLKGGLLFAKYLR